MQKRNKIILLISSTLVVAIVVAILIVSLNRPHLTNSAERNTILLNETFPSDIIVYGEDFYVPDYYKDVKYRRVTSLNETTLASSDDFIYSFIVIIDSEGKLILSDEELDLIKRLIDERDEHSEVCKFLFVYYESFLSKKLQRFLRIDCLSLRDR